MRPTRATLTAAIAIALCIGLATSLAIESEYEMPGCIKDRVNRGWAEP